MLEVTPSVIVIIKVAMDECDNGLYHLNMIGKRLLNWRSVHHASLPIFMKHSVVEASTGC